MSHNNRITSISSSKYILGDSLIELKKLKDHSVDMVFCDPPYNLQLSKTLYRPDATKVSGVNDDWDKFNNFQDYDTFTKIWLSEIKRILKADGCLWVIGSYHNIYRIGYILQNLNFWILNDENFFHSKDGDTLSQALVELYGPEPYSPIGSKLKQYILNKYDADYDPEEMTISFLGTHGYKWKLGFGNPLAIGYSLEYKKPRQRLWRVLTRDTSTSLNHSNEIFSLLHRLLRSPGNVIPKSMDWTTSVELCKLILPVVDGFDNLDEEAIRQACMKMEYEEW